MNKKAKAEQKMEWIILEKLSLNGLSLQEVQDLITKKINIHGKDAVLELGSNTETNYSYREDSSYATSRSFCHIKKLVPALTLEEKNKQHQKRIEDMYESVVKMFEGAKLVPYKK